MCVVFVFCFSVRGHRNDFYIFLISRNKVLEERSSWKATLLAKNKDIIKYRDGYMKIKEEKLINENL